MPHCIHLEMAKIEQMSRVDLRQDSIFKIDRQTEENSEEVHKAVINEVDRKCVARGAYLVLAHGTCTAKYRMR